MTRMDNESPSFSSNKNSKLHSVSASVLESSEKEVIENVDLQEIEYSLDNEDKINANNEFSNDMVENRSRNLHHESMDTGNWNYTFPDEKIYEEDIESLNETDISPNFSISPKFPSHKVVKNNLFQGPNSLSDVDFKNDLKETHKREIQDTNDKEKKPESLNLPPQSCYISHGMSSEILIRETELELNKLQLLTSKSNNPVNKAIYKLAYDESLTDQSETEEGDAISESSNKATRLASEDSRSEIIVHEADSASDAGSEDVELLPHRFATKNTQSNNKHIYVNNLSLAVELLRTKENLPYDSEFKRICDETEHKNRSSKQDTFQHIASINNAGTVNLGFIDDRSNTASDLENQRIEERFSTRHAICLQDTATTTMNFHENIMTDCDLQSGDEIGQDAREAVQSLQNPVLDIDDRSNRNVNAASNVYYRQLGNRARQQFHLPASRASIINPCFCCILM